MECFVCGKSLKGEEAEHIAITVDGDPVVMCDKCYEKIRIFFETVEGKEKGKNDIRRSARIP